MFECVQRLCRIPKHTRTKKEESHQAISQIIYNMRSANAPKNRKTFPIHTILLSVFMPMDMVLRSSALLVCSSLRRKREELAHTHTHTRKENVQVYRVSLRTNFPLTLPLSATQTPFNWSDKARPVHKCVRPFISVWLVYHGSYIRHLCAANIVYFFTCSVYSTEMGRFLAYTTPIKCDDNISIERPNICKRSE